MNSGVSVALSEGDRGEIERRLAAITDDTPTSRVHRRMASLLGKPGDAIHEIRALLSTASDPERVALAVWAAYYQDSALALSILAEVIPKRGHPGVLWLPLFAGARGMPGFSELAHRLGMADYWRARKFADFCEPLGPRQIKCR